MGSRSVFECESLSFWSWIFAHILSLGTVFLLKMWFCLKEKPNMSFSGKFLGSKSVNFKVFHLRSGQLRNVNELCRSIFTKLHL